MRTDTKIINRFLAAILALMIIIAIIPINVISASAATEDFPDDFTITVKDSTGKMIDGADIDYSVKVDGEEQSADIVSTEKGIAVINDMDTLDFSSDETVVTFDAVVSKMGYENATVDNEIITEPDGNIDIVLTEKETVKITFSVKDSVDDSPVTDANISIQGYNSVNGKIINGVFDTDLYKGELYSVNITKKGY